MVLAVEGSKGKLWGRCLGISILALALMPGSVAFGDVCQGTYTYEMGSLWDLSGSLDVYFPDFGSLEAGSGRMSIDVTQDPKGKILGSGTFDVCSTEGCCEGTFTVKGSVKRVPTGVRVILTIKILAVCSIMDEIVTLRLTEKVQCVLNEAERELVGTVSLRGSVCVAGMGCLSLQQIAQILYEEEGIVLPLDQAFETELEPGMDGSGTLAVNVADLDGKRLAGDATLTLSNGRQYAFAVTGKHNPRTLQNVLKLQGDPLTSRGVKFSLILDCSTGAAVVKGQFAGRKVLDALEPQPAGP